MIQPYDFSDFHPPGAIRCGDRVTIGRTGERGIVYAYIERNGERVCFIRADDGAWPVIPASALQRDPLWPTGTRGSDS